MSLYTATLETVEPVFQHLRARVVRVSTSVSPRQSVSTWVGGVTGIPTVRVEMTKHLIVQLHLHRHLQNV